MTWVRFWYWQSPTTTESRGLRLACWLVHRSGLARKPHDASWRQIDGVGLLCGIGFTMSIVISAEPYEPGQKLESAKIAVMIGSITAAVLGTLWLRFICPEQPASVKEE